MAGSHKKSMFCGKLRNCLLKELYLFPFPPAVKEHSCYPTSSSAFGVVSVLIFTTLICVQQQIIALICISLITMMWSNIFYNQCIIFIHNFGFCVGIITQAWNLIHSSSAPTTSPFPLLLPPFVPFPLLQWTSF